MKKEKVSDIKKALFTLLFDQYDVVDMELDVEDDTYVDYILGALVEKNGERCPFKNYDCIGHCKTNMAGCAEGLDVDCNRELEDVWREFIGV